MLRPVAEVLRGVLVPVHLRAARLAGEDLRSFGPTSSPPQPWWSIDEGNHRSATTRRRPERSAVYLRVGLRAPSPVSETARRKARLPMD